MSAADYDLCIDQGATYERVLTWKQADGNPVNLEGYTARMLIRRNKSAPDVIAEATTENGYIALGGDAGTITLTLPATLTETFVFRRGVYDMVLVSAGGQVTRLLEGGVTVSREVTR